MKKYWGWAIDANSHVDERGQIFGHPLIFFLPNANEWCKLIPKISRRNFYFGKNNRKIVKPVFGYFNE
jgi:hypothetical protein